MSAHADVFVIGAGPAGLTAAYCLTKENPSVIVIEKDPVYVGGISRTVEYNGFMFDIGGHRFFSKAKDVVDLWKEILPDDFIERPRLSRIYYGGKYYSYPLSAFEALANLGIFTSAACMLSFGYAKLLPIESPANFHEWVRNQFGEKLFSIFFKTYTEKVWGMSCDDISADWAAQRIKGLDLGVAVMNALKKALLPARKPKAGGPVVKTLIESFQYPRKGPGMMWEAASRKIQKRGGKVLKGRELQRLSYDHAGKLWHIEVSCADGSSETYTAHHVVSSAPVRELVEKITPTPISRLHARSLRYRDFLTVALMVRKPDLFPDNWINIHDPSVQVGRVQNFRSWSPEMVQPGMSCLGLEYFCFEGDGLWSARVCADKRWKSAVSISIEKMSIGTETSTGPGRPVVAMWNASRIAFGRSCALITSSLCLVTDRVMPTVSHSWKASWPMACVGTWPVRSRTGSLQLSAVSIAAAALSMPGPGTTVKAEGRPVERA